MSSVSYPYGTTFRYTPNNLERFVAVVHDDSILNVFPSEKARYNTLEDWIASLPNNTGVPLTIKDISITPYNPLAPIRPEFQLPVKRTSSVDFQRWLYSIIEEHVPILLDNKEIVTAFNNLSTALDEISGCGSIIHHHDDNYLDIGFKPNDKYWGFPLWFYSKTLNVPEIITIIKESWKTIIDLIDPLCREKFNALQKASNLRHELKKLKKRGVKLATTLADLKCDGSEKMEKKKARLTEQILTNGIKQKEIIDELLKFQ